MANSNINTFGQIFRKLRLDADYTQRKLAEKLKCDFTYISKIENNKLERSPSEEFLIKAAYLFKVDCDWLVLSAGKIPRKYLKPLSEIAIIYQKDFVKALTFLIEREDLTRAQIKQ